MMRTPNTITGWSQLLMLLGSMGFGTALAQSEGLKIGYVDPERLLLSAPQTKVAMDTLNDEFAPRQRELVAMESSLRQKNETYERDREVMGQEERTSLERELREGQRDLQRANTEFQEDLNIRRNELLATAQRAVSEQIEVYAAREGYDLILQNAVYHSPGLDITDSVLSFLNRNVLEGNRSEE